LTEQGLPAASVAERLTEEGYRPARGGPFGAQAIYALRRRLGLAGRRPCARSLTALGVDEWWATDLGRSLGLPGGTLQHWIRRGWVRARQEERGLRRWIVRADAAELRRLQDFRRRAVDDELRHRWSAATPAEGRDE
jgi:hypothetical protein